MPGGLTLVELDLPFDAGYQRPERQLALMDLLENPQLYPVGLESAAGYHLQVACKHQQWLFSLVTTDGQPIANAGCAVAVLTPKLKAYQAAQGSSRQARLGESVSLLEQAEQLQQERLAEAGQVLQHELSQQIGMSTATAQALAALLATLEG